MKNKDKKDQKIFMMTQSFMKIVYLYTNKDTKIMNQNFNVIHMMIIIVKISNIKKLENLFINIRTDFMIYN